METYLSELDPSVDPYPLLTKKIREEINKRPEHLIDIEESELLKLYSPNLNDRLLRQQFWKEYFRASSLGGTPMITSRIYSGVVTADTFLAKIITNPLRLSYLLIPPKGYMTMMTNLMDLTMSRFYEILSMDIYDKDGKPIPTVVNAIVRTGQLVKESLYGAAVQKNINVNTEVADPRNMRSIDDIDKKILEAKSVLGITEKIDEKPGTIDN